MYVPALEPGPLSIKLTPFSPEGRYIDVMSKDPGLLFGVTTSASSLVKLAPGKPVKSIQDHYTEAYGENAPPLTFVTCEL